MTGPSNLATSNPSDEGNKKKRRRLRKKRKEGGALDEEGGGGIELADYEEQEGETEESCEELCAAMLKCVRILGIAALSIIVTSLVVFYFRNR